MRDADLLRAANQRDLEAAAAAGLAPAMLDRLTLSDAAIATMVEGLTQIVALADPIGEISNMKYRPSGIQVGQMRVPLGVIGIIYEARPNVTVDAAGLCIKSGNATILRGGSEAIHCNRALAKLVAEGLAGAGLPQDAVQVVDTTDRAAVGALDHHAGVCRRDRAARRQGPDRAPDGRGHRADDQAPRRHLPRVYRRQGRHHQGGRYRL